MSNNNKFPHFPQTQPTQEDLLPWLTKLASWGRNIGRRLHLIEQAGPSTRVFTSYNWNDPDNQPDKPPQDGDGDGWSRIEDKDVVWMSQKVAPTVYEGEWGTPVLVKGSDGHSALRAVILSDAGTVFHRSSPGETPTPSTITLSVRVFYGSMEVTSELDSATWYWDDGSTAGSGTSLDVTVSDISGQDRISVEVVWWGIVAEDEITLVDVADGADGVNGAEGVDGEDGTSIVWQGTFDSHPASPQDGWAYRNSSDGKSYTYQSDAWYQMTVDGVDGVDGQDGLSIVWKGDLASPPSSQEVNWAYRDTDNGQVYIWNGSAWELMVVDGSDGTNGADGADGLSVFITYHDNPADTQPSAPTGDGTSGGWHTDATSAVVWMSQKVAADASSGTWGTPVQITGVDGEDAVQYYIKPVNGTALHNSDGTLIIEARRVTGEGDELLSSGTVRLYDESDNLVIVAHGYATLSDGYTGVLDSGDINGDIVITLKDGAGGTPLDTVTLVDVQDGADGTDGTDAVFGAVEASNTLAYSRAKHNGSWSPNTNDTVLTATFYRGGSQIAQTEVTVSLDANVGALLASKSGTPTGEATTRTISNNGSAAVTVRFTHDDSGVEVEEKVVLVEGGNKGEPALYGALDFDQLVFKISGDGNTRTPDTITGDALAYFNGEEVTPDSIIWEKRGMFYNFTQIATGNPVTIGHSSGQSGIDAYVDGKLHVRARISYLGETVDVPETLYDVKDGAGLAILYTARPDKPAPPEGDGSNWTDNGWHGIPFDSEGGDYSKRSDINWLGSNSGPPSSPAEGDAYYDTSDGNVYIYVSSTWEKQQDIWRSEKIEDTSTWAEPQRIKGEQGDKGSPGQNTYTAYYPHSNTNKKPSTPAKPDSGLTPSNSPDANGWYWDQDTAANNGNVWFLSIKSSRQEPGDSDWANDTWSEPIQIRGERGPQYMNQEARTLRSERSSWPSSPLTIAASELTDMSSMPSGWSADDYEYVIHFKYVANDNYTEFSIEINGTQVWSWDPGWDAPEGEMNVKVTGVWGYPHDIDFYYSAGTLDPLEIICTRRITDS